MEGSVSRKNNQDEIVGVFLWEKVWFENSLSQSERGGDREGVCPSTATGYGEQRPQVEASSKYVKEKWRCVGARKPGAGNRAY